MGIYIDIYPHFFRKFPFWGANLYISPSIYIPIRFDFFSPAEQNLYISPYFYMYFPKFSRLRRESIYIPIYIYPHTFSIFSLQKWIYIYPHLYISPFTSVATSNPILVISDQSYISSFFSRRSTKTVDFASGWSTGGRKSPFSRFGVKQKILHKTEDFV